MCQYRPGNKPSACFGHPFSKVERIEQYSSSESTVSDICLRSNANLRLDRIDLPFWGAVRIRCIKSNIRYIPIEAQDLPKMSTHVCKNLIETYQSARIGCFPRRDHLGHVRCGLLSSLGTSKLLNPVQVGLGCTALKSNGRRGSCPLFERARRGRGCES